MKYCTECGAKLAADSAFCENCGAKVRKDEEPKVSDTYDNASEVVGGSGEIKLCSDGKYRWIYEFPMLKNPTAFLTVLKVMAICSLAPAIVVLFSGLGDGFAKALGGALMTFAVAFGVLCVLSVIGYLITAAAYGGKYIVLFIMDDKEVTHIQQERQFKKAQGMAWLTAMAGAAAGNPQAAGAGILAATKNSVTSEFKNVEEIVGLQKRSTIKVNQLFAKNQIYVNPLDYDFVYNHIVSRCPKARIK